MEPTSKQPKQTSRRSFLTNTLAVGAGTVGAGLLFDRLPAVAAEDTGLRSGDVVILRFLPPTRSSTS